MTLLVFGGSATAPKLVARLGVRSTLAIGLSLATVGFLILATVDAGTSYALGVLPGGMLVALGAGWSLVPATIAAVKGVPQEQNGLASGVVNTSRLVGGTLGLAVLTTVATSHTNGLLAGGSSVPDALTGGYKVAFLIGAATSLAAGLAAVTLLRGHIGDSASTATDAHPATS